MTQIAETGPGTAARAPARQVPPVPPRLVLRAVTAVRNFLRVLVRRMVPAPVAMFELINGLHLTSMIRAVCKLGIAEQLGGGPKTAAELARATGAGEEALSRLMRTLISVGIFARTRDGRYRLNALGGTLRPGAPGSLYDLAVMIGDPWHVTSWAAFPETLRTGKDGVELVHGKSMWELIGGTEEGHTFDRAMVSLTQLDAPAHARGYDFSSARRICDVGGGQGTLLAHVLARHPQVEGVLFDDPRVIERAPPLLDSWGVRHRVRLVGGDFFQSVPPDCDLYLMRDILHNWDDERALAILKTVRRAMPPSSRLLVVEMVMTGDDGPFPGKFVDLEMMVVLRGGKQRTPEQFRALFAQAGLALSRVVPTSSPFSLVEARPT